jgi:hypothetical protein
LSLVQIGLIVVTVFRDNLVHISNSIEEVYKVMMPSIRLKVHTSDILRNVSLYKRRIMFTLLLLVKKIRY